MTAHAKAVNVIAAAVQDYRLITPIDTRSPHAAAEYIAMHLTSAGWRLTPDTPPDHADIHAARRFVLDTATRRTRTDRNPQ